MSQDQNCNCEITVVVEPPQEIQVETTETIVMPITIVEVPGIQGASSADKPLVPDPLEEYLKARGNING